MSGTADKTGSSYAFGFHASDQRQLQVRADLLHLICRCVLVAVDDLEFWVIARSAVEQVGGAVRGTTWFVSRERPGSAPRAAAPDYTRWRAARVSRLHASSTPELNGY